MEPGFKRTTIARIVAGVGFLCGAIALLTGITGQMWKLSSLGWGTGGVLLVLIALFVLVDGAVSFEKSQLNVGQKH
jgi:uncharacterized membrane protein YidH (DUF202 family)